jgi:hypothetical protein
VVAEPVGWLNSSKKTEVMVKCMPGDVGLAVLWWPCWGLTTLAARVVFACRRPAVARVPGDADLLLERGPGPFAGGPATMIVALV